MSYRSPPKATFERARETEQLIRDRGTDTERWSKKENLARQWDARAALAAKFIPGGSSVLDIGAGAMALGALLAPGCTYQPADVVERRPGCFVVDLNRQEFPPGTYDWVTYLGVLEYIHDVRWPLVQAAKAAPRMIVTYCTDIGADPQIRRGMGWVNDISADDFRKEIEATGWRVDEVFEVKRAVSNIQLLHVCTRIS